MGSDQAGKNEIEPSPHLLKPTLYVADRVSQCEKQGELRAALARQGSGTSRAQRRPKLGEVIAGTQARPPSALPTSPSAT
jgi:ornithine cyclodeaminase/alanine dehydrogenase-like protein (mu-crystallin family)